MKVFAFARSDARLAGGLAALFLVLHLPFLAPSLEDIDSINFALALGDYNVAEHQPHPPGYPVYIALGRAAASVIATVAPSLSPPRRAALALSIWSAIGGAVAIVAAWALFAGLQSAAQATGDSRPATNVARWSLYAATLTAVSPLFWVTALRPMSDMTGLALALSSLALVHRGITDRRTLIAGAALAGLAVGVRVQMALVTLPLFVVALVAQRRAGVGWLARPLLAFLVAVLAWGIPLLALSGGLSGYLGALGSQAGEDFAWVDMLLFNPTPRRLAIGLMETFLLPWDVYASGVVLLLAAIGLVVTALRERRSLLVLAVAFGPYTIFHLLLQETFHVRYALPVLPAVAWLATRALADMTGRRPGARALRVAMAAFPLVLAAGAALPAGVAYGAAPHPAFRAIDDANAAVAAGERPAAVFSHFSLRRPLQASPVGGARYVEPVRSYEWLDLVDYWVGGGRDPVWFFADPYRSDLALIDRHSEGATSSTTEYRWPVAGRPELGGVRPAGADWHRFNGVPGWFAAEGWALTPETGGLARATTMGVDREPIDAYVRRRDGPMHLLVGVRHLGAADEPATAFELTIDGSVIDRWTLDPAAGPNDLRFIDLPQGLPAGPGDLALLQMTARSTVAGRPTAEVAVRQFDVQPAGRLIWGFGEGWHEAEYESASGTAWRWTSDRSLLRVKGGGDLRILLRGESPLRYVGTAPHVRVTAAGKVLAELQPSDDFEWTVDVPAADVAAAGGAVAIESDRIYLPGEAEGTADARRLGLRLFQIEVHTLRP